MEARIELMQAEEKHPSPSSNHREFPEQLLTKTQVAQYCQVTPRSVDQWMARGYLVYLKIGRTVRFRLSDVQAHLDAHFRVGRRA